MAAWRHGQDGVWHAYQQGKHDVGAHGFNATLEDWGRFGEFVARDGRLANGKALVPDGWFDMASAWTQAQKSVSAAHPEGIYGFQWWNNAIRLMPKTSNRRLSKG
nr:putative beta-lactamase [Raoultella sp. NCTC 9187]